MNINILIKYHSYLFAQDFFSEYELFYGWEIEHVTNHESL